MKHFDMIVELIGGRITAVGSYDELLSSSPSFGDLVSGSR